MSSESPARDGEPEVDRRAPERGQTRTEPSHGTAQPPPGGPEKPAATARTRARRRVWALGLGLALLGLIAGSISLGPSGFYSPGRTLHGLAAVLGLAEPLEGYLQAIVEWRLARTLTAVGVGACLALSGAFLQGVFRNELAAPSILGVSSGASFGAALAIVVLGGYGPTFMLEQFAGVAPLFVSLCAFAGAVAVVFLVTSLATSGGRISVPTLLLVGIALNAILGGLLAAIQSFVLRDFEVARAIFSWTFGTLDDRSTYHVGLLFGGLGLAALAIPFTAYELDLFAGGEEDAAALGVDTRRVKLVALLAAALAAAAAVSVAGQIGFLGLVVPHILRLTVDRSNRVLLPLCLLGGPVFLLGTDFFQQAVLRQGIGLGVLPPGVFMSLIGGPFFLFLLVRNRAELRAW